MEEKISQAIEEVAYEIFCRCNAKHDYCVQAVGDCIVFGGTNRLILSLRSGWKIDEPYCSPQFIETWNEIKKEYY
jgi:hypothetical protein